MDELLQMLREMGVPFAYDHFAEGESPDPPFVCYLLPGSRNFAADGKVYHRISRVHLEVYTDRKEGSGAGKADGGCAGCLWDFL